MTVGDRGTGGLGRTGLGLPPGRSGYCGPPTPPTQVPADAADPTDPTDPPTRPPGERLR